MTTTRTRNLSQENDTGSRSITSKVSGLEHPVLTPVMFVFLAGVLLAWDTQQNKCFIHWKADSTEIGIAAC